jgi:hypothetical protein
MRSIKYIAVALLLTLLVSVGSFTEAQAKQSDITIVNKTSEDVTFKFSGDKTYNIEVDAGTTVKDNMDHDIYWVTYTVCGTDFDWKLDFNEDEKITLYPCKYQPTKMQVKSHLVDDVELTLDGYDDYEFDIEPGKNTVNIYSGNTGYEYEACDGQIFSGEIFVEKNGTTQLVLHSCEWFTHPARIYGKPNPVKFRIVNHASFPVIMTLIGQENYLITINPGLNVVTLVSGSYKYSYYQDGSLISGHTVVTPNGIGVLVITPEYVYDYVDSDELE